MSIKNIDTDIFKNAYREGKKAFKKAIDDFNKKADPFMGEVKESAKKVFYGSKLEKLSKEFDSARIAYEKSCLEYKNVFQSGNYFAELPAKKEMDKKLEAFNKAWEKYRAFEAQQLYAQQAFDRLNS